MYGAKVTVLECLFMALLPARLGNIVGGALGMGFVYWYLHDDSARQNKLMNKFGDAMQSERFITPETLRMINQSTTGVRVLPPVSERPEVMMMSERSSDSLR